MKKLGVSLLLLVLSIILLSACNSENEAEAETDNNSGSKKITLWYWNRGLDESVLEKVKEEFPDIQLDLQKLPPGKDYKTKLTALLTSKPGKDSPDLVLMNIWLSEYLPYSEKFLNLYDYNGKDIEQNYPAWKVQQGVSGDGKTMIAVPVDTAPTGLFYREDIFKDAGIASSPEELSDKVKSWDNYVSVLQELKDKKGVYAESSMKDVFSKQINKLDKRYFDADNKFIGDQEHIKQEWDKAISLGKDGLVLGNIEELTQEWNAALINGEIVGYDGPVWAKDIIIDTAPALSGKWKVSRSPVADGNDGGSFLSVLKSSKNPEIAVKIAEFINNEENQVTSYKNMSLFPAHNKALANTELGQSEEYFGGQNTSEVFVESAKNVKEAFRGTKETIVSTAFRDELDLVATENKDPEKAWQDALDKIARDLSM
ncbi:ABC transporter substrate-binding protein [Solibacillus sp. R5-41]|uniref:ABC transporter substrate-binding protein n=1 Tax=Solibacillus sp. R5-41 TaxID=2048654 RepID=UPI0012FD2AC4|nr:ABC transporter substrate-binding protein [Solibacillus sp. R5-41]